MENTTNTKTNRRPRLTEIFDEHMAYLDIIERRINDSFDNLSRLMNIEPKSKAEV